MFQRNNNTYSFLETLAPEAEFVKVDETSQRILDYSTVETIATTGMT